MSKIVNALIHAFTVPRKSAAASQPRTQEGRRVNLSETRPKNRLREFFGRLKSKFTRKNLASRNARANPEPTSLRSIQEIRATQPETTTQTETTTRTETRDRSREFIPMSAPQERVVRQGADLQSIQQPTHAVIENAGTEMPKGKKMLSQLEPMVNQAIFHGGLNVTADYIQDFSSNNISFTDSEGTLQSAHTLDLAWGRTASYSDHLTEFCGGDQVQALRLSALLTIKSLDVVSSSITGQEDCQWLNRSFDVSKEEGGQIKVEIKGTLEDQTGKRTKVENVTIAVPPQITELPLAIETVALLETQE